MKRETAKLFGSKCYVCERPYGKRFTFHHLSYKSGEKIYSDFENGDDYNEYVIKIIKNEPSRFILLCVKHHFAVETLKRFKKVNFERLVKAVRMST